MSCGHITVTERSGATEVMVQGWVGRLEGFLIESANVCEHPSEANWPPPLKPKFLSRRQR